MSWFEIDKDGLAAILERRGKAFAVLELIQNAWDSGATEVSIELTPVDNMPYVDVNVADNSAEGWADINEAFTMFSRSRRGADPEKRGRFCMGEKLALAICTKAEIDTNQGKVVFSASGRKVYQPTKDLRATGTIFNGRMRMTRFEYQETMAAINELICPIDTYFMGSKLHKSTPSHTLRMTLPTEFFNSDGDLRKTSRETAVEVYPIYRHSDDSNGGIYEMGIKVCDQPWPWRLNVMQKIPLGMERDSVTDSFRKKLLVGVVSNIPESITEENATEDWVQETMGNSLITPVALDSIVKARFGDRAVIASPTDPIANATAAAQGSVVIHGGSLSGDAWANIRKHQLLPTSSQAYPTPKPTIQPEPVAPIMLCPHCHKQI